MIAIVDPPTYSTCTLAIYMASYSYTYVSVNNCPCVADGYIAIAAVQFPCTMLCKPGVKTDLQRSEKSRLQPKLHCLQSYSNSYCCASIIDLDTLFLENQPFSHKKSDAIILYVLAMISLACGACMHVLQIQLSGMSNDKKTKLM